jgi:hypothetical protein
MDRRRISTARLTKASTHNGFCDRSGRIMSAAADLSRPEMSAIDSMAITSRDKKLIKWPI